MERDFKLDRAEYQETIWFIRQYPRFLAERKDLLGGRAQSYDYPRGRGAGDPVGNMAIRLEKIENKIRPIEKALRQIPKEYRDGLMKNIIFHVRYPDYADPSTWKRWRRRLVWFVHEFKENYQEEQE